jgi:hypothetical protein
MINKVDIETPLFVLIELLLSGELLFEDLTDEQKKQIPKSIINKM